MYQSLTLEQGSPEWLSLRKQKITATDAAVILGQNPWKTRHQLYQEKITQENKVIVNERMQRGIDLEPYARNLFSLKKGIEFSPAVLVQDWQMASLDGISPCGKHILEIKCPGDKDHALAKAGKIPEYYYPQLQHQMYVAEVDQAYYFSFDGFDGETVEVARDEKFIKKMIAEEKQFYEMMQSRTPPELSDKDYVEREDEEWCKLAAQWQYLDDYIKHYQEKQDHLRQELIVSAGGLNVRGAGLSICQVTRKGNVDYSKIPELQGVQLDAYRKKPIESWMIRRS